MPESDQLTTIYLSLGSNLGDRLGVLAAIQEALPPEVEICQVSSVYQTEPWGYRDQPDFLNQVLKARTSLDPLDLLDHVKSIERSLGRQPALRFGPRTADIDILFYGDQVLHEDQLTIPHPRLRERAFVLVPLLEISPDLVVPGSGESISDLLQDLDTSGVEPYQE
jgi:2-amino-4-hydroxy-6-hydroxymethyldihydropteridine diphosphokinase